MLIKKKEIYIREMELEATASQAINGSLEVRVGGKSAEIGTLAPIRPVMLSGKSKSGTLETISIE